ncbi:MAG: sigma-70 family RNA polymerase sigma factor [Niabella sp.]
MQVIDTWYCNYKGRLLAIACQRGYDYEEAKDIVHQFFLDLLQKELTDIRNPEAYLLQAFKHRLIDLYRLNSKARIINEEHSIAPSALEIIEDLEANNEMINRIAIAYKKLPARYRRIIYLKYYRGLTTEQIVEETGFTYQTVYNNLSKGIRQLRLHLEHKKPLSKLAGIFLSLLT